MLLEHHSLTLLSFWVSLIIGQTSSSSSSSETFYQLYRGAELQPPCLELARNAVSIVECVDLRRGDASCKAGSYHATGKRCCLRDAELLNENVTYTQDDGSVYFQLPRDYEGWTLVFKADAYTGVDLLQSWEDQGHHDDPYVGLQNFERGCFNASGSKTRTTNFRSKYLDEWDTSNIQEVSYRMYKNGEVVANLVFNGKGSTVKSWMTPARLVQTPWTDMTTRSGSYNYFGIIPDPWHERLFFNKQYGACVGDIGWIAVANKRTGGCSWEGPLTGPVFIYSYKNTAADWMSQEGAFADVMAIFVKF